MQGFGFAFALDPWLEACWGTEPEQLLAARRRHLGYFNTHPIAAWLTAGVVCRQEAEAAVLSGAARETAIARILPLKTTLGAPLAGIYDCFFWGALRPVSALAGILVAQAAFRFGWPRPLVWAALLSLAVYNVPAIAARALGLSRGFSRGERAVASLTRLPVRAWIQKLRWATAGGAFISFAVGAGMLGGGERLTAGLVFAAGLILAWRSVPPLTQLALAGAGGMAASAAGLWP
jgi:PTS system mannose-specific IID component